MLKYVIVLVEKFPIFYYSFIPFFLFFISNQNLKNEAATALEQLREAESEAKALRTMTQRMILTQEEMVCLLIIK